MIWRAVICLVLSACLAWADEKSDSLAKAGIKEFAAAYEKWDAAGFAAAADLFQQACVSAPASVTNYYWLGVARFHRLLQLRSLPSSRTDTVTAAAAIEAALRALEAAVELDERHAETHASLGTFYGMKIDGNLLRAARFGPRAQKPRSQAFALGAENPRVRYLLGTCQFHIAKKAAARGEALASFLAAEKLFVAEARRPPQPLEPRWGRSSCLTFIGRTYELLGQRAEAAEYFRKALAEHPADFVAKEGLTRVTKAQEQ